MKLFIILLLALNGCGSAKDTKDKSADAKPAETPAPKADAAPAPTPAPPPRPPSKGTCHAEGPLGYQDCTPEEAKALMDKKAEAEAAQKAAADAKQKADQDALAAQQKATAAANTKDYTIMFKYKLSTSFNGYSCTDHTDDKTKSFPVLKTTYDDYLKSPKCEPFGSKTLSCSVTDNSVLTGTTCLVYVPAGAYGTVNSEAHQQEVQQNYSKFIEPVWPVF